MYNPELGMGIGANPPVSMLFFYLGLGSLVPLEPGIHEATNHEATEGDDEHDLHKSNQRRSESTAWTH